MPFSSLSVSCHIISYSVITFSMALPTLKSCPKMYVCMLTLYGVHLLFAAIIDGLRRKERKEFLPTLSVLNS